MDPGTPSASASPVDGPEERRVPAGRILNRLASGLLVLLASTLPFEAPLFRLGPLQMTSVELVLYATIAAGGLVFARDWARAGSRPLAAIGAWRGDPMVLAALVWLVVPFASAIGAGSFRAAASKFALRSASGVLVFFVARRLTGATAARRRVIWALLAGALLSSITATLEWLVPSSSSAWEAFREGQFDTLGLVRASGVFGYPTIGAMYWEAAVPLLVTAPLVEAESRSDGRSTARLGLVGLGTTLLVTAILASATRSGLAGAALASAALLALGRRSMQSLRPAAIVALAVIVTSSGLALSAAGSGSPLGQRLRWWHDDQWLRAEYQVDQTPRVLRLRESFAVPITLRNTGAVAWRHAGAQPVHLGYHWERVDGPSTLADYEGKRTALPADVPPGGEVHVVGVASAPSREGSYRLRWDLAQEGSSWFSDRGNAMPRQSVEVRGELQSEAPWLPSAADRVERTAVPPQPPSRLALWKAALVLWRERPWLGIGPDNFRRSYQAVLSPAPTGQPYTDTRIHANSLFFETLADLGLAGMAALALIGWALLCSVQRHAANGRLALLGTAIAAGAFFLHGTLDYFFEFTPLLGLFWLLLGLTAAGDQPAPPFGGPLVRPPSVRPH